MDARTISAMQPIGDAATELADLLGTTHTRALDMLYTADSGKAATLYRIATVTIGSGDIRYTVTFGESEESRNQFIAEVTGIERWR